MSDQITIEQAETLASQYEARAQLGDDICADDLRREGHLGQCPWWEWRYVDAATDECLCVEYSEKDGISL